MLGRTGRLCASNGTATESESPWWMRATGLTRPSSRGWTTEDTWAYAPCASERRVWAGPWPWNLSPGRGPWLCCDCRYQGMGEGHERAVACAAGGRSHPLSEG